MLNLEGNLEYRQRKQPGQRPRGWKEEGRIGDLWGLA